MARVLRMYAVKKLVPGLGVTIALTILLAGQPMAQPPLGAGNEVRVDVPDTAYVGQEVELNVHMANTDSLARFSTAFNIYSQDGAQWNWVVQPASEWDFQGEINIVSRVEDFRFWDYLPFCMGGWGPVDSQSARFILSGVTFSEPLAPPGPLEHAYTIHIRPTITGTICIDSAMRWTGDEMWIYTPGGKPAWNGPICFTVVESTALGDVNCDGAGNVADAVYIINWIFKGGPEPCR
jgi:hypothetical protein